MEKATRAADRMKIAARGAADSLNTAARAAGRVTVSARAAADGLNAVTRATARVAATAVRAADGLNKVAIASTATAVAGRGAAAALDKTTKAATQMTVAALAAADALNKVTGAAARAAVVQAATGRAAAGAGLLAAAATRGWGGLWGALNRPVRLFGGLFATGLAGALLGSITRWHLLVDVVGEFLAVLIPAGIALTIFGAAAASTVSDITKHFHNALIVTRATGQAVGPLTGKFQALSDAVKPQVYQLYGDALTLINSKSSALHDIALATGHALDVLAARFVVAATHGGFLTDMLRKGSGYVATFGDIIGNLGNALGQLLKAVPGYAAILLSFVDSFTKIIAVAAHVLEPIIAFGLALHGAIVWAGLAVTAILALRFAWAWFARTVIGAALIGALEAVGLLLVTLASAFFGAATAADAFAAAELLVEATGGPIVWIAAAVTALGVLVYWSTQAKDASQSLVDTVNKGVLAAPVTAGLQAIASAHRAINEQIRQTEKLYPQLTAQAQDFIKANPGRNAIDIWGAILPPMRVYLAENQHLSDQAKTYTQNLNMLGRAVGGNTTAMGLLTAAGVTQAQMLDGSDAGRQLLLQMVLATAQAYLDMGQTGGILGNDMAVLTKQSSDQYTQMVALNGQWDTFIANATATQQTFDTYVTGLATVAANAKKTGATMGGLNAASITLNSSFATQVTNTAAMIDTWRLAGVATNLFKTGVKDAIAPLIQFAKGSQSATDLLVALAEQAGFTVAPTLQNLVRWLGNTHNATKTVQRISQQATQQEALLNIVLGAQATVITTKLLGALTAAQIKYSGLTPLVTAWGKAIAQSGVNSDVAKTKLHNLVQGAIDFGNKMQWSTDKTAAFITKLTGIPLSKSLFLVMTAQGTYSVNPGNIPLKTGQPQPLSQQLFGRTRRAAGWRVPGYGGGDQIPVLVERGETIVPKHLTPSIAPLMKAHGVPGFARGGLVSGASFSSHDPSTLGDFAVNSYQSFTTTFVTAVAAATRAAIKSAAAAAAAAAARALSASVSGALGGGGASQSVGGGVSQWSGTALRAMAMLGIPASDLGIVLSQIGSESGGNPGAVNRCVPLDTEILTRRGWLKHSDVRVGDETIGYDLATGRSAWTRITAVHHYDDAPLIRTGNSRWHATTTPEHRWLSLPRIRERKSELSGDCPICDWPEPPLVRDPLSACPECGWVPLASSLNGVQIHRARKHGVPRPRKTERRIHRGKTTQGGLRIHLGKVHGITEPPVDRYVTTPLWVVTGNVGSRDRLLLAAPADTGDGLAMSTQEAALLGWIAGDGHVGGKHGCRISIGQTKRQHFPAIESALRGLPHARYEYPHRTKSVTWTLRADYARDLMRRVGHPKNDAFRQVLAMSPRQRAAWLKAMIAADGHVDERGRPLVSQALGPVHDAIVLAFYLSGRRPRVLARCRNHARWSDWDAISGNVPVVTGAYLQQEDAGRGPVWCVTTDLGSWTAEEDGHVFLTGNSDSNWIAGHPSVGLLQVIRGTFAANAGPFSGTGPFAYGVSMNPLANIYAGLHYALSRYGSSWTSVLGHGHGYDQGGWLAPGLTLAMNATGRPERVLPPGESGGQMDHVEALLEEISDGIHGLLQTTHPSAHAAALTRSLGSAAQQSAALTRYSTR